MRSITPLRVMLSLLVVTATACSNDANKPEPADSRRDSALELRLNSLEEKIDALTATQARSEEPDPEKVAKLDREVRELSEFVLRELVEPTQPRPKNSASGQQIAALEKQVAELERRLARMESGEAGDSARDTVPVGNTARSGTKANGQLDWRVAANWRGLKRGMSKDQVSKLFGEPTKIITNTSFTRWYYGYPRGGHVSFDTETDKVNEWEEP